MEERAEAMAVAVAASFRAEGEADEGCVAPPNPCPPRFVRHTFEKTFQIEAPRARVWEWLETPDTFIRGQIWPFRVEFVSHDSKAEPGFTVGGLNAHHGPLMSFCGQLTEIREGEYRSLHYFYGSYVLSMRLVRPTCLEFWVEDGENESTSIRLRVSSFTHFRFARIWTAMQRFFWRRFPRWMSSALGAKLMD